MSDMRKLLIEPMREMVRKEIRAFLRTTEGSTHITALGTVTADYAGGLPKVKFDSDDNASSMRYSRLSSYSPAANDRVLMVKVGNGWVVVGKVATS